MSRLASQGFFGAHPSVLASVELLKPITWFPPMWAFLCGVVSVGPGAHIRWSVVAAGVLLAGPLVCGTSQAVNDWFDRHVDAINEPKRPIPSGRLPGRTGLYVAIGWTLLSLLVASTLGPWGIGAAVVGLALAWAYSTPPIRLKKNGWWGNSACALCYEGLPWITGAAIMSANSPNLRTLVVALLYSAGAHGIMTLNDFKSVRGDRRMGIASLPVQLGVEAAAIIACFIMAVPQLVVVLLLFVWGHPYHATVVALLWLAQLALMDPFLEQPVRRAEWYSATGVSLYVLGMLVTAVALRQALGA